MTNGEKYQLSSHRHYVFERQCPHCGAVICGREPSDFGECKIKNMADFARWLNEEAQDDGK